MTDEELAAIGGRLRIGSTIATLHESTITTLLADADKLLAEVERLRAERDALRADVAESIRAEQEQES